MKLFRLENSILKDLHLPTGLIETIVGVIFLYMSEDTLFKLIETNSSVKNIFLLNWT